ncbi:IclR family transcriptional regulator [Novosphingobium malaysiense]|uniref:IclR family transcriptional regulator n=1 Tax=Novosphingobium malaysiense TaxID=1348853 RepID=UPI00068B80F1|nr:helix-turn-helix domain-containing protein [Novosphingobium malaysiense]
MATVLHDKKIKSADRVLEIFEMFNANRQAVTVMEVARELQAPQSSTSELLGSLVRRGYLVKERGARLFRPTSRVALLGAWVHPTLFRHGNLLSMMDKLDEETGLGVVLGSMLGVTLKHIHTVGDLPEEIGTGSSHHVLHSPMGHALLTTMFSDDLRLLVHRLNSESDAEQHVKLSDMSDRLRAVSRQGAAIGEVTPGWTGIAVLLPQSHGEEQLSLGVVGPTEDIEDRKEELIRHLRQAISGEVGPRVARGDSRPARPPRYVSAA